MNKLVCYKNTKITNLICGRTYRVISTDKAIRTYKPSNIRLEACKLALHMLEYHGIEWGFLSCSRDDILPLFRAICIRFIHDMEGIRYLNALAQQLWRRHLDWTRRHIWMWLDGCNVDAEFNSCITQIRAAWKAKEMALCNLRKVSIAEWVICPKRRFWSQSKRKAGFQILKRCFSMRAKFI